MIDWEYRGTWNRSRLLGTLFEKARLTAVEDLIVSPLISANYCRLQDDMALALMLAARYQGSLGRDNLDRHAREERVSDLFAEPQNHLPRTSPRTSWDCGLVATWRGWE